MVLDDALTLEQVCGGRSPSSRRWSSRAAARERIAVGRAATEQLLADGRQVYGLTTGVGAMKRVTVGADEQADFNRLLLLSHRTGTGPNVRRAVVRAALLAQLAGFGPRPLGSAGVAGRSARGGAERRAHAARPRGGVARPV